jgi:hypothetical protein
MQNFKFSASEIAGRRASRGIISQSACAVAFLKTFRFAPAFSLRTESRTMPAGSLIIRPARNKTPFFV